MAVGWLPTGVAVGTLALNAVLDVSLYRVGIWGIPLATSLANIVGAGLLLFLLRRRVGAVDVGRVAGVIARVTAGSIALGAVAFGVWYALDAALGRSVGAQIVSLGVSLALGLMAYLGACRILQVRELDVLRETVSRRVA